MKANIENYRFVTDDCLIDKLSELQGMTRSAEKQTLLVLIRTEIEERIARNGKLYLN